MEQNYIHMNDPVSLAMQEACKGLMSPPEIKISGCVLPKNFLNYAETIRNMEVRPDDIWVLAFPKCGTTWTQEMVWLLANGINFDAANSIKLHERYAFVEVSGLWPEGPNQFFNIDSVAVAQNLKSPRFLKSHLPPSLLPKQLFEVNPKIIYVHRNPKDAAVSYFHHFRLGNNYTGTLDQFLESYVQDKQIFSPFWEHVLSFWAMREKKNLLILSYESMKRNLSKELKRTADFLEVTYTEEQEKKLLDHLSFNSMKENPMVNLEHRKKGLRKPEEEFIRKGQVNGWKEEMSLEMSKKFDEWTEEKLAGTDFQLYAKTFGED